MTQVFTSYSRRDTETVDRIVGAIEQNGLDVWLDRQDIEAGDTWRVQIVQAIDECHAFVLMLSPNAAASDNVRKEIDLAQDSQRTIFAVMLEPVKLPAEIRYQLAGLQFIDVKMLGLEQAISQLIETLKEHIAKVSPVEEPKTVELVIQGMDISAFDAAKQAQLLDFLAKLSNADRDQLKIEKVTAGSVHVLVRMPGAIAYQLKTLALNHDQRFKQLGIAALRLVRNRNYVNTTSGQLTPTATAGLFTSLWRGMPAIFPSVVGATAAKLLTILTAVLVIAGIGLAIPRPSVPPVTTPLPATVSIAAASTSTSIPVPTSTEPPTPIPIPTITVTATLTETSTPTPTPAYQTLQGIIMPEQLACRYGPGADYLYEDGLYAGNQVQVLGRADSAFGTWVYVQYGQILCWINGGPRYIQLSGDVSSLEPYYPEKAPLILFYHVNFPPPRDVEAVRRGDQVSIFWTGYELAAGDQENPGRPVYLVEAWTCQGGKIVFSPIGTLREGVIVTDEAGCSEPSHAQVFVAHRDGYVGPAAVPVWPPYLTQTP